jgi:hypothetical protein
MCSIDREIAWFSTMNSGTNEHLIGTFVPHNFGRFNSNAQVQIKNSDNEKEPNPCHPVGNLSRHV